MHPLRPYITHTLTIFVPSRVLISRASPLNEFTNLARHRSIKSCIFYNIFTLHLKTVKERDLSARPLEEVIAEVKAKIKKWKKERTQSSKKATVGTLALAFIAHGSKGFRVKVKSAKMKYKKLTSKDYVNKLETYVLVKTKKQELLSMLTDPFQYNGSGYVTGALKDIPLDSLTKRDIEIWHSRMGSIPTTANRALAILSTAIEWDMKRQRY